MKKLDLKYEKKYVEIVKDIILEELRNYKCKVFLFGSRAIGTIHWASDIDIGIEMLDMKKFREIKRKIYARLEKSIVPFKVDIINFDTVSEEFKKISLKKIELWKEK